MQTSFYQKIENYMLQNMTDSAHDKEHVYRVLYAALDIAKQEDEVDMDVLIIACLLHDIGREDQFKDPSLCHAKVGSEKAYSYLTSNDFPEKKAAHIRDCIRTHRYRSDNPPSSIEAKILFDADKLDVTGTIGIARTFVYKGIVTEPLYTVDPDGNVLDGTTDTEPSFFQEYKFKLENIYGSFYTKRGYEIAKERQHSAVSFYNNMLKEVRDCYSKGQIYLKDNLE
ncbi:HD domain-containing protein [Mobilitalea sibirica]|uniref:HD domain-containing protein n=1 Tax=Mobilitalea sibirica TaxID=1462919 RepID=A0A8J7H633_9FIRM|nr:HD domain-containing protein [Mobilitalea sibirica]MBH1942104.1 HD domain-containing protein [Mobilitalea sibirica]